MARGVNDPTNPKRQVGPERLHPDLQNARLVSSPDLDLRGHLAAQRANARYLFGTNYTGTVDEGRSTNKNPMPGGHANDEHFAGRVGDTRNAPVFKGANPMAVESAQEAEGQAAALRGLMADAPDNAPMGNLRMVDVGMREGIGKEFPVHTYIDERIKLPKSDA